MPRLFALALPLLAVAVPAQHAPDRPQPSKPAPFVFEAGVLELGPLVVRCAAYLQQNILWNEGEARAGGRAPVVEFQQPVVTDRDGCEELLQGLLWSQGLCVVPIDEQKGVYEVLSTTGPRARDIPARASFRTPEQVLARPRLRQWVTTAWKLEHLNANIAANSLRPFFAMNNSQSTLTVGSSGSLATVLLTGPQDVVAAALQLLRVSDVDHGDAVAEQQKQLEELTARNAQLANRLAAVEQQLQRLAQVREKPGAGSTDEAKSPR